MPRLVIATRGSQLALWQANHVKDRLQALDPELSVELAVIKTRGDKILDVPLAQVGGKGLFVKEIEDALLSGAADLAVHSIKDVPMELPAGLVLGCVPKREVFTDCLVSERYQGLRELPKGAVEDDEDDVLLSEFTDEIEPWIIKKLEDIGCDTAKSVLALDPEDVAKRADLEDETVAEVMKVLRAEFED